MLEEFKLETKGFRETNRETKTNIDSRKKESAVYLEQNTLNFENDANITANSDSITPQKKKWERSILSGRLSDSLWQKWGK